MTHPTRVHRGGPIQPGTRFPLPLPRGCRGSVLLGLRLTRDRAGHHDRIDLLREEVLLVGGRRKRLGPWEAGAMPARPRRCKWERSVHEPGHCPKSGGKADDRWPTSQKTWPRPPNPLTPSRVGRSRDLADAAAPAGTLPRVGPQPSVPSPSSNTTFGMRRQSQVGGRSYRRRRKVRTVVVRDPDHRRHRDPGTRGGRPPPARRFRGGLRPQCQRAPVRRGPGAVRHRRTPPGSRGDRPRPGRPALLRRGVRATLAGVPGAGPRLLRAARRAGTRPGTDGALPRTLAPGDASPRILHPRRRAQPRQPAPLPERQPVAVGLRL